MSPWEEPPFERYLARVARRLRAVPPARRALIEAELRDHLHAAAAERGADPDDHALQAEVIAKLGAPEALGRELARANRALWLPGLGFLLLWTLLGGGAAALAGLLVETVTPVGAARGFFAVIFGGILASSLLHGVLVWASVARDQGLPGVVARFGAGWLVMLALALGIATEQFWEPVAESLIMVQLLLGGVLGGAAQWLALRGRLGAASLWPLGTAVCTFGALIGSMMGATALLQLGLGPSALAPVLYAALFGLSYSAASGALFVILARQAPAPALAVAGGGAVGGLSPIPSVRGDVTALASVGLVAALILALTSALATGLPPVTPATTATVTGTVRQVQAVESSRVLIFLDQYAAPFFVHEDHSRLLNNGRLRAAEGPVTITIYQDSLDQLDQPDRVRALGITAGSDIYLNPRRVAEGRNLAEPVLLGLQAAVAALCALCGLGAVARLLRHRASREATPRAHL